MKKEFEKEQNDNQIDDAFLDMPDMENDEKFRQWLEEEYLKEADAIEDAVRKVLAEGYRTVDIMDEGKKQVGTTEMGNLICDRI